jgi:hypothetical protein
MSIETITLKLVNNAGALIPATAVLDERQWIEEGYSKSEVRIELFWDGNQIVGSDWNYFAALCRVREQLEVLGLIPSCYGACRNLVVSGLQADMKLGMSGHLVRIGEKSQLSDCVRIFDSGPNMDLVSVKLQREFTEQWIQSVTSQTSRM